MLNTHDILETIQMIREENLDIRTVTMGISLFDCISDDQARLEEKIYDKSMHKESIYVYGKKVFLLAYSKHLHIPNYILSDTCPPERNPLP